MRSIKEPASNNFVFDMKASSLPEPGRIKATPQRNRNGRMRMIRKRNSSSPSDCSDSSLDELFRDFAPPTPEIERVDLEKFKSNTSWRRKTWIPSFDFKKIKDITLGMEAVHLVIERQIFLAHDLVLRLGWLDDPDVVWKYRTRRSIKPAPLVAFSPLSLIEAWMYLGLGLGIFLFWVLPSPVHYLAALWCFLLIGRGLVLSYWVRRLNWWGDMFNQFVDIYSDLDKHIKRSMNWFQELELISRGFREFTPQPSGIGFEPKGDLLYRFYKILKQIQSKFEIESLFSDAEESLSPGIQLSKVKRQIEETYIARTEFLVRTFSKLAADGDISQIGHLFDSFSCIGNGYVVQVASLLEPRISPTLSRKSSHSSDNNQKDLDRETSSLNQAVRSLNTLEFEMRTWHAQLHLFNQAITNKSSPPRALLAQFQRMVQSIHSIASDAESVSRHLENWCSPETSPLAMSPPLLSPDASPLPPPIFQSCINEDPRDLLSQKEEVFEGDPLPPSEPLTFEEKRTRRQALHDDHLLKRERQASFLSMVQELDDAIRTHAHVRAANRLDSTEAAQNVASQETMYEAGL